VPADGERLATIEQQIRDIRDDVASLTAETLRTRGRLHDLEGMIGQWVSIQKENRRQEDRQYRRLGNHIQLALLLVACVAVLAPILTALISGR
jgi:hypothetical protein